jgi:hypothetical protein
MKRLITIITLGFLVFFFAYTGNASSLKLSESSINFGSVKEGPPVTKKITLTNEGTEVLTISNTATSCACTTVDLSKSSLNPGESTELLITYDTYKYPGKFDKTVTIFTGTDGKEETVIHILGNVDPIPMGVIVMEPRKTVVGELLANKENTVQVIIKNTGDAPLKVSRIYSSKFKKEYFNSENSGEIEIGAGKNHKIDLAVSPPAPGRFLDVIMIYSDARNDIGKGYKGLLSGTAK